MKVFSDPYRWYSLDDMEREIQDVREDARRYVREREDEARERLAWALEGVADQARRQRAALDDSLAKFAPTFHAPNMAPLILSEADARRLAIEISERSRKAALAVKGEGK